ncbi:hypothetical protein VTO42DRAFT_5307 [Malbranchea cinnamomea]
MSLHIYIAHTGEQLLTDPVSFASPDALRTWIFRSTSIPPQRQILMTSRGRNVRLQTLMTENEIFVFDRQFVSEHNVNQLPQTPIPEIWQPDSPPDFLADQNNLQAWRDLYMARRSWALDVTKRCAPIAQAIDDHNERTDVIYRAINVALENLKSHVGNLERRFQEAQAWANDLLKEQRETLDGWQDALAQLENIPVRQNMFILQRPSTPKTHRDSSTGTLKDYVDVAQVKDAASQVSASTQQFARHTDELEKLVRSIVTETKSLLDAAQPPVHDSPSDHIEELETIAKKISSDYEHVLGLPNSSKALSSVSRMALNHTKDLLPSMVELCHEMRTILEQSVKRQNEAIKFLVRHMHAISITETKLSGVLADINNLDIDGTVYQTLYAVFHWPVVYGSVLIECVRRREWSEKIKADSSALAEELAVYRDEEHRRRKKWIRNMGDFLAVSDDSTPSVEINLQSGHGPEWPEVSRQEVEAYIQDLKSKGGFDSTVRDLNQQFKDLDSPTRQQKRRTKAFKHGSFVDMGRSSILGRGDDMVRSLKDEKAKLEEKLKGSETRIRKLEDLLHRQTPMSRPVSAHFGPDVPTSPASPRPDSMSRRSSVSSHRMPSNHAPEDKTLAERIMALEAELAMEKDTVAKLQREAELERQASAEKIEEIQSTKKDLMKNLEAQQREFEDERRHLMSENKTLQIKLEELEEEYDRVLDSRDHERHVTDNQAQFLQKQLDETKKKHEEERTKLSGELQEFQKRYSEAIAQNEDLQRKLQDVEKEQKDHILALQTAHFQLSPEGAPPTDFHDLVKAIEILSEGLAIHAKQSDETSAQVTEENKTLNERISQLESELESLREELNTIKLQKQKVEKDLENERLNFSEVRGKLEGERKELQELRARFAAGETGTEALKERIAEEEREIAMLNEKLAIMDTRASAYNDELLSWRRKVETLEEVGRRTDCHLEARGTRAEYISRRLHSQIEHLARMLEQLGFTIVYQDDQMSIQRTSKVTGSSVLGESVASSGFPPTVQHTTLVSWIQSGDPEEEALKYAAFINAIEKFDIEVFSEVVVKRVKDIETLARKWQKEARGYREKYHRAQSEAHEKIAYRSFKEGDLALFLPTRNQSIRSWAAFNVGAPHYFLREQDVHRLNSRDWLVARITKIEERVVDLSKSINGRSHERRSSVDASDGVSVEDDNPFQLSDGLRWYLLDASEEKPGAPSTPGLGKSTVASAHVDAKGSIRLKRTADAGAATRTLTRSLDSRRNSSASKKGAPVPALPTGESSGDTGVVPSEGETGAQPRREQAPIFDEAVGLNNPQARSATASPIRERQANNWLSPSPSLSSRPRKSRTWERLFSLDYRSESSLGKR